MEIADIAKKLGEWAALLAVVAVVGSLWVDREVERRMNELLPPPVDASKAPAVVANTTKLQSLEAGQARIEGKVDAFSDKFLEYLEREASR